MGQRIDRIWRNLDLAEFWICDRARRGLHGLNIQVIQDIEAQRATGEILVWGPKNERLDMNMGPGTLVNERN